jgi:hypothetical protein
MYEVAVRTARSERLPSGRSVRLIAAPAFVATKLEAFRGRGADDFLASHDLEDVIVIVDGRPELARELPVSEPTLRAYVADELRSLLQDDGFVDALPGYLPGDDASQARLPIVRERLRILSS